VEGFYKISNLGIDNGNSLLTVTVPQEDFKDKPEYPKGNYLAVINSTTAVESELTLWRITPAKRHDQYFLVNKRIPGVVVETPRYGDFHKFVTIGSFGSSCRANDADFALKFTAMSLV